MIVDSLYGSVPISDLFEALLRCPEVQRLRHVFLSNVPSFDIPGIAYISRFEHSIGTLVLADIVARARALADHDAVVLKTAALLHDVSMPSLGHLLEEAFRIAGIPFDHESHLQALFDGRIDSGGTAFQVFAGHEATFRKVLHDSKYPAQLVTRVLDTIRGHGSLGQLLNGSLDIDNIDNVCRIAYHMGLPVGAELPRRLATVLAVQDGALLLQKVHVALVEEWQRLRSTVYHHLMFAPRDFAAKTMLVRSLATMIERGRSAGDRSNSIIEDDWRETYEEATTRLSAAATPEGAVLKRFYGGDLYHTVALFWIDGDFPGLAAVIGAEQECARVLGEPCVLYGIPDKRNRAVKIRIRESGELRRIGSPSQGWLLGFCVPRRETISAAALDRLGRHVARAFSGTPQRISLDTWVRGPNAGAAVTAPGELF